MIALLTAITTRLQRAGVFILAVLAAVGGAFVVGRYKGHVAAMADAERKRADERAAALESARDAAKDRSDADTEAADLPAGGAADRLTQSWSRD